MSDIAIHTRNLSRRFGNTVAVNALDLTIATGTIYGFLGPNGSGKSTTLRLLTGLLQPSSGEIRALGYDMPKQSESLRNHVGYMTQKFSLFGNLTVRENLDFVRQIYSLGHASKQRIDELLIRYGLQPQQHLLADALSGGQKQRLALAAAIIHQPKLLLLDEPTSAVDPENRREFWERLFDLCNDGTTILVSTHYMDEAERCHGLAIMDEGRKVADGTPEQLMQNMGANVVEVEGPNLRQLKTTLLTQPDIISVAQLGVRLRVLINNRISEPHAWLQQQIDDIYRIEPVRASLEDVFVTSTQEAARGLR